MDAGGAGAEGGHVGRAAHDGDARHLLLRRDVARCVRCYTYWGARRLESSGVDLRDAHLLDRAPPEMLLANRHDGVLDVGVLVDVDVGDVHDRRTIDDDVVDDARPTPAGPRRSADEVRSPPPRDQRLAPAQRDPADSRDADRDPNARSSEERDERRSIHGPDDHGPRRPRPGAAHEDPAAIVIWSPAPRRRVDPRPAVVRIENPSARAVRGPAGGNRLRHPHRAVRGDDSPIAVVIEVIDAVHAGGNVPRADRIDQIVGARVVPAVPDVELRRDVAPHGGRGCALENHLFARRNAHRLPTGRRHRRLPGASCDERASRLRHVDAVVAGALDGEGRVRGIDLHRAARFDAAQVERDVAAGHLDLEKIGLVIDEPQLRVAPGPHECARTHLKLEIAAIARVELVSRRQRRVDLRGSPVLGARPVIRDLAVGIAQPGRDGLDRAFFALSRSGGPGTESHLENERQSQKGRNYNPCLAPEHVRPPSLRQFIYLDGPAGSSISY